MVKLTIHWKGNFDAAHWLRDYEGKCANMHGHRWLVDVWINGTEENLSKQGMLMDFGDIKRVVEDYDHTCLNEHLDFQKLNPTAENIVLIISRHLKALNGELSYTVRVHETPTNWAEVSK